MENAKSAESDASSGEEPNAKRRRRDPNAVYTKTVKVLLDSDVLVSKNNPNVVLMPNTIEMEQLRKKGRFCKMNFTSQMSQKDVLTALHLKFPILRTKRRLGCASAADNRTRLDFHGDKRIWNGALINRHTRGNSALYVFAEENHQSEESQVLLEGRVLAATQRLKQLSQNNETSSTADQRHLTGNHDRRIELTTQADHTTGGIFWQQGLSVAQKMPNDAVLQTTADPVAQASQKPFSMMPGSQQRAFISHTFISEQGSSLQQAPPATAAAATNNVPVGAFSRQTTSTKKLSVNKRKSQPNGHEEFPFLSAVSKGETTDLDSAIDSASESGSNHVTDQFRDIVHDLSPKKGSTKGGDEFYIILREVASFELEYVAYFQNCGRVPLKQLNPFTLTGFTPKSLQGPGQVNVTLLSSDKSWWGGEAEFEYIDDLLTDEVYQSNVVTNKDMQLELFDSKHEEGSTYNKLSAGQTSDSFGKTGAGSSSLNQNKCAWSVKLLQVLVYKAAEIGGWEFIQMIFSTSAGKVVFNSYRNCATLPEDVARTNGHLALANYLQDVDSRLSKESNSDAGTESIDWLELKHAVVEKKSLTSGTDDPQMLKECQPPGYSESDDDDDESDYFADEEISPCSSPCHSNVFDSENEAQSQNSKESSCEQKVNEEDNLPAENNDSSKLPLHLEGNQLEVIVFMKAENAGYKHKQLDSDDVESHSSGDDITEKEHESTKPCYGEVEPMVKWDPLGSEEDSTGTANLHTATHKCHNVVVTYGSESDLDGGQTELRMIDNDENSKSRAWQKPTEKSVCMLADHASQKNAGISTERLLKDIPFEEREPTIRDPVLGLAKLKQMIADEFEKYFLASEDHKAKSRNHAWNQETSDTALRVTVLASEWSSPIGSYLNIHEQLVTQFAQHKQVQTTLLVPQFACTEEEKNIARGHNISIREAERRTGYSDPLDWLSFPPSDLAIDVVVGQGLKLGKQAQVIRQSHGCKWVHVVHTAPEELVMYKDCSKAICKGEEKTRSEVDLCKFADAIVTVGPKVTEAYSSVLRSCGKHQDIIELTPGTLGEFSDVTQATMDGEKFNVLIFGRGDPEDFNLKGYDIAVEAIAALNDTSYRLIFVGAPNGKEEEVAKHLLQSGICRCQLIIRTTKLLKRSFCGADLVIMPSRKGFGLIALEALSAGLPILVSGNSGFGYALRTLPSGKSVVVDSKEPNDWAKAIAGVRQKDRTKRLQEIQRLRMCYEETFSWEKQFEALVEKMQKIVPECANRKQTPTEYSDRSFNRMASKAEVEQDLKGEVLVVDLPPENGETAAPVEPEQSAQENSINRKLKVQVPEEQLRDLSNDPRVQATNHKKHSSVQDPEEHLRDQDDDIIVKIHGPPAEAPGGESDDERADPNDVLLQDRSGDGSHQGQDIAASGIAHDQKGKEQRDLLDSQVSSDGPTTFQVLPGSPSSPGPGKPRSLPCLTTHFIGRKEYVEKIIAKLRTDRLRMIEIISAPGMGKTEVAIRVSHSLMIREPTLSVIYVERLDNLRDICGEILDRLHSRPWSISDDLISQAERKLSELQEDTVIVLDNTEDVQGKEFDDFAKWLVKFAPKVQLIITTCQDVGFVSADIHKVQLGPLDVNLSAELLRKLEVSCSEKQVEVLGKLCGGIPLLLINCACLLKDGFDPEVLIRELRNNPIRLLKCTVKEVYDALGRFVTIYSKDLKETLIALSVFPSTFSPKDIEFLFDDELQLQRVKTKMLTCTLLQKMNDQKLGLHPLLLAYCRTERESLEMVDVGRKVESKFNQHYLERLKSLSKTFITKDSAKGAIEGLRDQKVNIMEALKNCFENANDKDQQGQAIDVVNSNEVLDFLAKVLSPPKECAELYRKCCNIAKTSDDKRRHAESLNSLGFRRLCDVPHSKAEPEGSRATLQLFQEAHDILKTLPEKDHKCQTHAHTISKLGLCHVLQGDIENGRDLIEKGIKMREELGVPLYTAAGNCDLGNSYRLCGDHKTAIEIFKTNTLSVYKEELGDHPWTGSILHYIADSYKSLAIQSSENGYAVLAETYFQQALECRGRLLGFHQDTARSHVFLSDVLVILGDFQSALNELNKALKIQQELLGPQHRETIDTLNKITGLTVKMRCKAKTNETQKIKDIREKFSLWESQCKVDCK